MALNVVFGPVAGLALIGAARSVSGCSAAAWPRRLRSASWHRPAGWPVNSSSSSSPASGPTLPCCSIPLAPETGSNSFPSGHVSFAVALGFALYFLARGTRWAKVTAVAAAVMALVVAWSRLYIGVHYPTDVAASFLAASAAVVLLAGLWNRFAPRIPDRPAAAALRPAGRRAT